MCCGGRRCKCEFDLVRGDLSMLSAVLCLCCLNFRTRILCACLGLIRSGSLYVDTLGRGDTSVCLGCDVFSEPIGVSKYMQGKI